ncbi:MAG: phosphatidate cytidylyltransferase [Verrucomicrobia bacterium]|nr:phosphatidate cytidylyltransferase [Verrucomicrobiota bacterium]
MPSTPPDPGSQSAGKSRLSAFFSRFGSTLVLWLFIGGALVSAHPVPFFVIILLLMMGGLWEFFHLLHMRHARGEAAVTMALSAVYVSVCFWSAAAGHGTDFARFDLLAIFHITVAGFLIHMFSPVNPGRSHIQVMACVFAFIYITFLFNFITRVSWFQDGREQPAGLVPGRTYLLFGLAVTKFTDMGAYIVGSLIGKHKMVPHLSPGKTWEGFAGAIAFAYLAAFTIAGLWGRGVPLLTPVHTAILAGLIALGAVVGDLAESTIKRSLRAKDSGHVMPGIGGVLDLIDSILVTTPILYFYLEWIKP